MARKLKVRIFRWEEGKLKTEDHYFFNHNRAMDFAHKFKDQNVKIYNLKNQLIYEINNLDHNETYA